MADWRRFEKFKTENLISEFQKESISDADSNDLFLAISFRFRSDLLKKCEFLCKRNGHDIEVAYTIVDNTFKKYHKYKNFKFDIGKQETVDLSFKFYLYTIAKNERRDFYKREQKRKKGLLYTGKESIVKKLPEIDVELLDIESRIIHETLLQLPYSHQVIYLTYKMHEKDGVNMPTKLLEELREHLNGISQPTVRGYKKEAIDKIELAKEVMSKMNQLTQ